MILGQLKIWARTTTYAALLRDWVSLGEHKYWIHNDNNNNNNTNANKTWTTTIVDDRSAQRLVFLGEEWWKQAGTTTTIAATISPTTVIKTTTTNPKAVFFLKKECFLSKGSHLTCIHIKHQQHKQQKDRYTETQSNPPVVIHIQLVQTRGLPRGSGDYDFKPCDVVTMVWSGWWH